MTTLMLLRGDPEALVACLQNPRASLPRAAFVALSQRAVSDRRLRDAIVRRADLPDAAVDTLWPILDAPQKARLIAAGFRYDAEQIAAILGEAAALRAEADESIVAARLMAHDLGLDEGLVLNIVYGAYERGVVVLGKGAGIGEHALLSLICRRASARSRPANLRTQRRLVAEMSSDEAAGILGQLDSAWSSVTRRNGRPFVAQAQGF